MTEIKLEKRYPHSRTEDITDAFMRGYQQGKEDEHRWWSNHCANCKEAEQTEPNSSEKPNNCKYAENPSGDVWECGCFLDTYCEHQIYDRNPDGTINIVKCGYEPKDEPTWEQVKEYCNKRCLDIVDSAMRKKWYKDEPQTERSE